jgi:hypothetical protein
MRGSIPAIISSSSGKGSCILLYCWLHSLLIIALQQLLAATITAATATLTAAVAATNAAAAASLMQAIRAVYDNFQSVLQRMCQCCALLVCCSNAQRSCLCLICCPGSCWQPG